MSKSELEREVLRTALQLDVKQKAAELRDAIQRMLDATDRVTYSPADAPYCLRQCKHLALTLRALEKTFVAFVQEWEF